MADEKKRKLLGLKEFRRRLPHVSQRGLATTLQEIKRTGMPELDSCKDMRTARDIKLTDPTPYGPISIEKEVTKYGGGKAYLRIASPLALLWFLYFSCTSFSSWIAPSGLQPPSFPYWAQSSRGWRWVLVHHGRTSDRGEDRWLQTEEQFMSKRCFEQYG